MNLNRILAVFIRQWFLFKTNPIRLFNIFLWLFIDIIQWGFISKYLETFGGTTSSLVAILLGGIILWGFMSRIQQGIMMAFLEDNWSKNFINYFASPLKIKEYLSGLVMTSFVSSILGFLTTLIVAQIFFGYSFLSKGLMILPFFAILLIFGIAIGFFVSALVFRYGATAEWISWPIPFVISIFCGVYYPISTLPGIFQIISKAIPPSYAFESFRRIIALGYFSPESLNQFWIGFALATFYLALSYAYFIRVYKHNLKTGGISRLDM